MSSVVHGTQGSHIPLPFYFSLLSLSSLLPQTKSCPCHFQTSSILLTHGRTCTRKTARDTPTLFPLTHKMLQARSLPSWNRFADVSSSPVDTRTIQAKEPHTSPPLPGSRQCRSRTELIPGCRRGSPAEAAGAAQCSGEERQGN